MAFETERYPGVAGQQPPQTEGMRFNHSMLRIKDPERSLAFYTHTLGMRVLRRLDFEQFEFSLYFLACGGDLGEPPEDTGERTNWLFSQTAILELTHNWGTEDQSDFSYHNGNGEPQGFGHICITVADMETATAWFDENEVSFVKRPDEGGMKGIAFIRDPDGYWIEIVQRGAMRL